MPTLTIAGGPTVQWGRRRASRVFIVHRAGKSLAGFRFTLALPRGIFGDADVELDTLELLASALVSNLPKLRQRGARAIALGVKAPAGRGRAQLSIPRADLPHVRLALERLMAAGVEEPALTLGSHLYARCFTDFVAQLVTVTPRRGDLQRRRATLFFPAALVAILALIDTAKTDARLEARIRRIVEDHAPLAALLEHGSWLRWNLPATLVVGLLARAFHGAVDIALQDPIAFLRQHRYGKRSAALIAALLRMRRDDPATFMSSYLRWAEETYLGEPGAALKTFGLPARSFRPLSPPHSGLGPHVDVDASL